MLKLQKNCKVCTAIKLNKKLAEDIYKTQAYDRSSKISLAEFHRLHEDKFSYRGLTNHVDKHQALTSEDLTNRHLKNIAQKAEKQMMLKKVEANNIWDAVMEVGYQDLQDGRTKVQVSDMLRAAKDKSDHDLKVKDQELAMIEMVYHFASAENQSNLKGQIIDVETSDANTIREADPEEGLNFHSAPIATDNSGEGADGSRGVYYPPSWDAPTFGTG